MEALYPGKKPSELNEEQKQYISTLATIAGGLAAGVVGNTGADAVQGAQSAQMAVENNYLSATEAAKKAALERKEKAGTLTADEAKELADTRKLDKDRDQAIHDICTQGNKSGAACTALVAQAQQALNSYGESAASYRLIFKDLYPEDAANANAILKGLDEGSITRDAAITAIAEANKKDWNAVAAQYDRVMQLHGMVSTLAGVYGIKSTVLPEKGNSPLGQGSDNGMVPKNPNYLSAITDNEAGGYSYFDRFRKSSTEWDWPKNLGFAEDPVKATLPIGTRLDRYGEPSGSFLAPKGTPYEQRALAPGAKAEKYYEYEVIKPLPVIQGKIAPAFGEPGGGIQILPDMQERVNVFWLKKNGYIKDVE
ncbi:glycohydrolase toxin TNT-related protein [Dickeya zeae]|uniref:glycohydrolase toxin TNT-related protein n=1 Tax=Dickeya zeae TaxID=204042 RepID=UPI001CFBB80F|nr:glycohydrolase toxin TNT-related protein [Dickeya zeae]UCZ73546.1 glycohydrolase toxin TNT-related protein [Dickeya zeae]